MRPARGGPRLRAASAPAGKDRRGDRDRPRGSGEDGEDASAPGKAVAFFRSVDAAGAAAMFSPFARKVRLALDLKGLDYEVTDGLSHANRSALEAVNRRVEVPAIAHDGVAPARDRGG